MWAFLSLPHKALPHNSAYHIHIRRKQTSMGLVGKYRASVHICCMITNPHAAKYELVLFYDLQCENIKDNS